MKVRSKLNEGMWPGDLADLVQPLISIDEYASKIDLNAITIGFYVHDKDAADDLNRFIQKSPVSIIDSDVSPAPDQRGYYFVFVEMTFNDRLVPNITGLLDEVSPLVSITTWKMKIRGKEGMMEYDAEKLGKTLKINHLKDRVSFLRKEIESLKTKTIQPETEKVADEKVKDTPEKKLIKK